MFATLLHDFFAGLMTTLTAPVLFMSAANRTSARFHMSIVLELTFDFAVFVRFFMTRSFFRLKLSKLGVSAEPDTGFGFHTGAGLWSRT